ncbi:MAG: heme exporter protein CcmD [Halieaceae bacterium]|nr:heme exporter protein CcmD [Halieaceae bacterium]
MYFDSWSDLWSMAGHGPFVWFSYGAFFVVIGLLVIAPLWRLGSLKRRLKQRYLALEKTQSLQE